MASREHVEHLLRGVEHWNEWRAEQGEDFQPDFSRYEFGDGQLQCSLSKDWPYYVAANLVAASFVGARLRESAFGHADLRYADFSVANLEGVQFTNANLARANFHASNLRGAKFWGADLVRASFDRAKLNDAAFAGARLEGAELCSAQVERADFSTARNFVLDACLTRHARFNGSPSRFDWIPERRWTLGYLGRSSRRRRLPQDLEDELPPTSIEVNRRLLQAEVTLRGFVDPWSRLRTVYTGPKFFFHLLFLVAFALPLVLNALSWKSANRAQQLLGQLQQTVAVELAEVGEANVTAQRELRESLAAHWSVAHLPPDALAQAQQLALRAVDTAGVSTHAELLARVNRRIGSLQPCLRPHCGPARPMWHVVLGLDRGWRTAAIAALLLLYNVGRFMITRAVGAMRDNEERTGWCPALAEYGPYYVAHKFMTGLFVVAVLGSLIEIGSFLFLDFVYLPL